MSTLQSDNENENDEDKSNIDNDREMIKQTSQVILKSC